MMKYSNKKIKLGCKGSIKLVPETPEDSWHVYNLLCNGDFIRAVSFRKVKSQSKNKISGVRKKIRVKIKIEQTEFDPKSYKVRVRGKNQTENPYIPLGSYHTIEILLNRQFEVSKKEWDKLHLNRFLLK